MRLNTNAKYRSWDKYVDVSSVCKSAVHQRAVETPPRGERGRGARGKRGAVPAELPGQHGGAGVGGAGTAQEHSRISNLCWHVLSCSVGLPCCRVVSHVCSAVLTFFCPSSEP